MDDRTSFDYSLPPFDVVVRSSWLAKRKCHCPAHIAQSSSADAICEDQVVRLVGRLDDTKPVFDLRIRCRQVVEHFTATTAATAATAATITHPNPSIPLIPRSPIELLDDHQHHYPCRVKDGRVLVEHNHFINSRIRQQFPTVPQGNTALLLETALEALAYRTVMTGGTKSRTTRPWTGVGLGSGRRSRDSSTSLPILNDANNADADAEMEVPMATINTNDNLKDIDAREPTSFIQRSQQWEKRKRRTNEDLQLEKGNDGAVESFLQPFVPREPSNEQQYILFISSSNNNNNNEPPPPSPSPHAAAAAAPILNCNLALYQYCNQQQHDHDDDEQCLELDLEMDEWDKQSEQSDFFDISEEEQQLDDDDDEDEDVDLELWREG
ncbi:hypothetical protein BGZ96_008017 [Linnemannia gamsii]|uniref:Uncharacterized protein n=1 Tax=Linnemannia gamsii TaxID=64522 RepID=A0ABQ7KE36_9FUNG|nr:hypothetical protein BGZ96_008017 [Linnemannia gamsii]